MISNSSDALNKLRQEAILDQSLLDDDTKSGDAELKIDISFNKDEKTILIADNGIGMTKKELIDNLGTIAKSGTQKFLEAMKEKKMHLIGQFGVGFYSVFMVAEKVELTTKKAGEKTGHVWTSRGKSNFYIEDAQNAKRGTSIKIYLKNYEDGFLDKFKITNIVEINSNHIDFRLIY